MDDPQDNVEGTLRMVLRRCYPMKISEELLDAIKSIEGMDLNIQCRSEKTKLRFSVVRVAQALVAMTSTSAAADEPILRLPNPLRLVDVFTAFDCCKSSLVRDRDPDLFERGDLLHSSLRVQVLNNLSVNCICLHCNVYNHDLQNYGEESYMKKAALQQLANGTDFDKNLIEEGSFCKAAVTFSCDVL